MITYDEAAKVTLEHLAENVKNDEKIVGLTIAGADAIGGLLAKTFLDLCAKNPDIPIPCFMVFPAAFRIAEEAFYEFARNHAVEGFAEDTKGAVEDIVNASRKQLFLKKLAEADRKEKNHD